MKILTTFAMLTEMTLLSVSAQERMNVVLKAGTVENFNITEVEKVVFDKKEVVSLQVGNAENITATGATIFAKLNADESVTEGISCGFFYETSFATRKKVEVEVVGDDGLFSVSLSDLMPGTTYYYQPYAIVNGVTYNGASSFFRTKEEQADNACVAFLSPYATAEDCVANGDDDEASAWLWFHSEYPESKFLYAGDIHSAADLADYRVLFYIRDLDSGSEDDAWIQPASIQQATPYIQEWYKAGGNLVLWQHAVAFITDLGRMDRSVMRACDHRVTIGSGAWNNDIWHMAVQINPGSYFVEDFSGHPLYKDVDVRTSGRAKYVTVKGPSWTEDHNIVFHNLPSQLTGFNNQDPRCYDALTETYGIYPLGVWDSQIDWVSQLNVWEARQGNTDYQGTILCVGNGGCEFSYKNADGSVDKSAYPHNNYYQSNVLKMARNAIEYLAKGELYNVSGPTISSSDYREKNRPQIHYTPAKNWINDPNGMVYADGIWHLYYQYNPYGQDWGNMSWGHATSTDLFHWKEQPVAIEPDNLGYIYSGSAVLDKNNTAGFGENAIVAMYTAHGAHEQQCIAYSTDGGMTFTKYEGNPVIKNTTHGDYRDPKVVWDEDTEMWYCVFALGGECSAQIWKSSDLKKWTQCSTFSASNYPGCNKGVWECTDLFPMQYKGERKWVLTVNVSGGGPVFGSGTMYFVGSFNGRRFIADKYNYPLWEDHGMDDYASVTWSNTGDRRVCIGWMNNQAYGGYPVSPWRCCMTLPREMVLEEYNGQPLLKTTIVSEIDGIADEWLAVEGPTAFLPGLLNGQCLDAYQVNVTLDASRDCVIRLSNRSGDEYAVRYQASSREVIVNRGAKTGKTDFHPNFAIPDMRSSVYSDKEQLTLCLYVDQSNVELTTDDGSVIMSTLVFPEIIYDELTISGQETETKVRNFHSVWREQE